ncbi:hypothetical protein LXL04_017928 [Taraxacum kok-saghyz]
MASRESHQSNHKYNLVQWHLVKFSLVSSSFLFYPSLSLLSFSYAASNGVKQPKPAAIHFPIRKNQSSLQYYISFESGNPHSFIDALIDLGERSVMFDCTSYVSSSYKRVLYMYLEQIWVPVKTAARVLDQGAPTMDVSPMRTTLIKDT